MKIEMKTIISKSLLTLIAIIINQCCYSQGFVNLNFESASTNGLSGGYIPASTALPSWLIYLGPSNNPTQFNGSSVGYDAISLGGALVILEDSNAPSGGGPLPLQGRYSALLQGSIPFAATTASIGQTGMIPGTAQSLTFWGNLSGPSLQVSFDGQMLSFIDISNALNYSVYGVDISPFAGETGQLLFTAPIQASDLLDNIQFSASPIPEPGEFTLISLGAILLAFSHLRKSTPPILAGLDGLSLLLFRRSK